MVLPTLFIALALASVAEAGPAADLVTDLPGLANQPTFKQYSGYLQGLGHKMLHYWFVESSNNPETDPLVLWMNGGPGCSSLDGFLTEHGPFMIQPDGKTLHPNPYSWNQVASIIYLEAPAGVGFSYSPDKDYRASDNSTAADNHNALRDFFTKFPEYKGRDFYITGESYGGIYVPTLAYMVLGDSSINLKGFAVGNGLSDNKMNDNSIIHFAYFHGLVGQKIWNAITDACCPKNLTGFCDFVQGSMKSQVCANELSAVEQLVWSSGLDVYNLYSECAGGVQDNRKPYYDHQEQKYKSHNLGWPFAFLDGFKKPSETLKELPMAKVNLSPPCVNSTPAHLYLNSPDVRKALHIPEFVQTWEICSAIVGALYVRQYNTMTPQYQYAISRKLRILVYNGDIDMACNFLGDEWFVDSLHKKANERKAWFYKAADGTRQIAGYVKTYSSDTTLVTVKGAGHMVPTDKPRPALEMFINFIQNRPYH